MDKYIIGHTRKSYLIKGVVIPKRSTVRTSADVAKVSEEQLKELSTDKLFKSLLDTNSIKVLDTLPSWAQSTADHLKGAQDAVTVLKKKNKAIRDELNKQFEEEKALAKKAWDEHLAEITEQHSKEIAELKATWEEEKASLIAEAKAEIERLTALIPKE